MSWQHFKNYLVSLVLPVGLISAWEISVQLEYLPPTLIAAPSSVLKAFSYLLNRGELWSHGAISLSRLLAGFALGTCIGIIIGIATGYSKFFEKLVAPTIRVLAPIPPIAWIPLFIVLFGIGEGSKIALIATASGIIVYLNTFQGLRSVDQRYVELAKAYNRSGLQILFGILLPSATAQIFTGMRIALGISWILLVAAELIASSGGLGWLIWDSRNFARPDDMIVGMICLGILGALSDVILSLVERKLLWWRQSFEGK